MHSARFRDIWAHYGSYLVFDRENRGCSRDGAVHRMPYPVCFTLTDLNRNVLDLEHRRFSPMYACAELLWYLSGHSNVETVLAYAPQYERFAENGRAYGAYGARWAHDQTFHAELDRLGLINQDEQVRSQLVVAAKALATHPSTRRAVVSMWRSTDLIHALVGDHADLPCTLGLQFLRVGDRLDAVAYMRSNDLWLGTPYDVFCFSAVQTLMAQALNLRTGQYTHMVGDLHLYDRNVESAKTCLQDATIIAGSEVAWDGYQKRAVTKESLWDQIDQAVQMERLARRQLIRLDMVEQMISDLLRNGTILADAVRCCAVKWYAQHEDVETTIRRVAHGQLRACLMDWYRRQES